MNIHQYTLLIVESPVIAEWIRQHQIPWLEVIATDGYLWYPVFDSDQERLTGKANPAGRKNRKRIRELAPWAHRIIVAADNDPAGDFITWSLMNFLQDREIQRTTIHHPGIRSIQRQIDNAVSVKPHNLKNALETRYLFNKLWRSKWKSFSPSEAALSMIFNEKKSPYYTDDSNNLFKRTGGENTCLPEICRVNVTGEDYYLHQPCSTYYALQQIMNCTGLKSGRAAGKLFQLFTAGAGRDKYHLISYPRTSSLGYYSDTWKEIEEFACKEKWDNRLKPKPLREIVPDECPHESLRPVDLTLEPYKAKNLLSGEDQKIYEIIFNLFMDSVTIDKATTLTSIGKSPVNFSLLNQNGKVKNVSILKETMPVGYLGHQLDALGVTRPSSFGKTLEEWKLQKKLTINGILLRKGPVLPEPGSSIRTAFRMLSESYEMIKNGNRERLKTYWNSQ